jgi:3-oxoacyl-[acyl-carrier protein] reductase
MNEENLQNKVVLITGVSRGLGKAFYDAFLSRGATVIGVVRNKTAFNQLMLEHKNNEKAIFYLCDLSLEGSVTSLHGFLQNKNFYPDVIVNNVGGTLSNDDPLQSYSGWRDVFRLNFEVAVQINEALIPHMVNKGWGRVCHISSIAAVENQGPPAYCAAKAALNAYVRSLARYVAPHNIILTTVMPGAILTDGGYWDEKSKNNPEYVKNYVNDRMAIKRLGDVKEITNAVLFLCSEQSSFCVGTSMLIDGGQGRVFNN